MRGEPEGRQWGAPVMEQEFRRDLPALRDRSPVGRTEP